MKIKLIHIIGNLQQGGAETTLVQLLGQLDHARYKLSVITLFSEGTYAKTIRHLGIPVYCLHLRLFTAPFALIRLAYLLYQLRPDVVQTWLYHSDCLGGIMAKLLGVKTIIWNVCGMGDQLRWLTRIFQKGCALLSRYIPNEIVSNSEAARLAHIARGYAPERFIVIPNGFNTDKFIPASDKGFLRTYFKLPYDPNLFLFGMLARYHAAKDYPNLLDAITIVIERNSRVHFVLCGTGLTQLVVPERLRPYVSILSGTSEPEKFLAMLDSLVLSSCTEGLANVIGEAMSCQVPCVVTDVGDNKLLVADLGRVVPKKNAHALAEACLAMMALSKTERDLLGERARKRIIERFDVSRMVRLFEELYA